MKVFKIEFYRDEDQEKYIGAVYYYAKMQKTLIKKQKVIIDIFLMMLLKWTKMR